MEPAEKIKKDDCTELQCRMTVVEHLRELRIRLIVSISCWIVASIAGWYLSPAIIGYFRHYPQLKDVQLILIRPPEAFFVRMKVAMVFGLFVSIPIIINQIMAFVNPAFHSDEKKWVKRFVPASILLFYGGAIFSLLVIFPITLDFFLVQLTEGIAIPQISLQEYVNYLVAVILAGGLVFQMPVALLLLTAMGILTPEKLRSGRKYAILAIFIVSAIVTPPDPFSQIVTAIPMVILYEICILFSSSKKTFKDK